MGSIRACKCMSHGQVLKAHRVRNLAENMNVDCNVEKNKCTAFNGGVCVLSAAFAVKVEGGSRPLDCFCSMLFARSRWPVSCCNAPNYSGPEDARHESFISTCQAESGVMLCRFGLGAQTLTDARHNLSVGFKVLCKF